MISSGEMRAGPSPTHLLSPVPEGWKAEETPKASGVSHSWEGTSVYAE